MPAFSSGLLHDVHLLPRVFVGLMLSGLFVGSAVAAKDAAQKIKPTMADLIKTSSATDWRALADDFRTLPMIVAVRKS